MTNSLAVSSIPNVVERIAATAKPAVATAAGIVKNHIEEGRIVG